jgi:hypothetical protein
MSPATHSCRFELALRHPSACIVCRQDFGNCGVHFSLACNKSQHELEAYKRLIMDSCTCNKPDLRVFDGITICVGCGASAEPDNTTLSTSTTFQSSDFDIESPSSHNSTDLVSADDEDYLGDDGPESVPAEYLHAPLDLRHKCCIRLIRLYPGRDDEDLVCQIIPADLNKLPVYEVSFSRTKHV